MPENQAISSTGNNAAVADSAEAPIAVTASNDPTAPEGEAAALVPVGVLLREAREKLGLSAGDIATKLRMGLKQVSALENSDYALLPTGTFLRGFVRNYARAVTLNANDVLALLEKTHVAAAPVKASSVVVPSQQNIKVPVPGGELASPKGRAFVIGVVGLLLLSAVWYWWEYVFPFRSEGGRTRAAAVQSIAVPQAVAAPESALPPSTLPVENLPVVDASATAQPAARPEESREKAMASPPTTPVQQPSQPAAVRNAPAPAAIADVPHTAPVPAGSATLGFTFTGESWVRVTDATGKTVISRLFKGGEAEEAVGRAPFSVIVGNAKATRMALNGREFALDSYVNANGTTARMTVK